MLVSWSKQGYKKLVKFSIKKIERPKQQIKPAFLKALSLGSEDRCAVEEKRTKTGFHLMRDLMDRKLH